VCRGEEAGGSSDGGVAAEQAEQEGDTAGCAVPGRRSRWLVRQGAAAAAARSPRASSGVHGWGAIRVDENLSFFFPFHLSIQALYFGVAFCCK
jgi:hypothetical protein